MANTKTNVTTAKPKIGGAVYRAPIGTSLPSDATTALANAFIAMGYISEEGVTNTSKPNAEFIKDWGGERVCSVSEDREDTFKMKFIESLNPSVLGAVYGEGNVTGSVTGTNGLKVTVNNNDPEEFVWVIETVLRGNIAKRIVIPSAAVTDIADIVYKRNEPIGYECTLTATADASGNYHYEYIKGTSGTSQGGSE